METQNHTEGTADKLTIVGTSGGTYNACAAFPLEIHVRRGDKVYAYERKYEKELTDVEIPQEVSDELGRMAARMHAIAEEVGVMYMDIHVTTAANQWGPCAVCRVRDALKLPQKVFEFKVD